MREAIESYQAAKAQQNEAYQALVQLEQEAPNAEQGDIGARVEAMEAGTPLPTGTPHQDAQRAKIEDARLTFEAAKQHTDRKLFAVTSPARSTRTSCARRPRPRSRRPAPPSTRAVAQAGEAVTRLQNALAFASFTEGGGYRGGFATQVPLRNDGFAVDEVLSGLGSLTRKPEPREDGTSVLVEFPSRAA